MKPTYLYKILSVEEWEKSLNQKTLPLSYMDEKFIHLSKEDQLAHMREKFWKNKEYAILKVLTERLVGRLEYEANPGGSNLYYHLYEGHIPTKAVESTIVITLSSNKEV